MDLGESSGVENTGVVRIVGMCCSGGIGAAFLLATVTTLVQALQGARGRVGVKEGDRSAAAQPTHAEGVTPTASSPLLEYLDLAKGTDELYEMLRTRSTAEIEQVCRTFPIETLRLDWGSIQQDFRNNQRFELITVLAQILVRYDEIRAQSPELRLPKDLPAEELAEILMSRLMPFIGRLQDVEMAESPRIRLYDFALALMQSQSDHDRDALTCLLASRPSAKEDHEFWICACRFNIAKTTKSSDDVAAAVESAEQIVSGRVRVPERCVQGARLMLEKLKEMR
jgi:hypothetical protein